MMLLLEYQTLYMHARGDIACSSHGILYSPYSTGMSMSGEIK